jgi:hypothetical protein
MFRWISVLSILIGFLIGQVAPAFASALALKNLAVEKVQNPNNETEPTSDDQDSLKIFDCDGGKYILSGLDFEFFPLHKKLESSDPLFSVWLIVSRFDRPPERSSHLLAA